MGTLQDQPPRDFLPVSKDHVLDLCQSVREVSSRTGLSTDQVLMAYRIRELERSNDLSVRNGNIFDEQMAGFGELLERAVTLLERMSQPDDDQL